ncbi:nuclease-related domain-containing protein [Desulfococcaceae bacterium HSG9]|nr:nuclease-related domain-containing protein [Desulfococcaceae bacterium HSG9]
MILKNRDTDKRQIEELKKLISYDIAPKQKFLIQRALNAVKAGASGEDDAAYFINFYYGNSKNWVIIHDLRIVHEGNTAQIDHLLINRLYDFYILESKSYKNGIKITENGEFEALYKNKYYGIPSPVEQNKRHIHLLDKFLRQNDILPKRIGITIKPKYFNYILISPRSIIKRPNSKKFDTKNIIKADTIQTEIKKNADNIPISEIGSIVKLSAFSTIETMAKKIVSNHKPITINWRAKFGVKYQTHNDAQKNNTAKSFCAKCKADVSEKVAKFCWDNKTKFKGRVYCFSCQKTY